MTLFPNTLDHTCFSPILHSTHHNQAEDAQQQQHHRHHYRSFSFSRRASEEQHSQIRQVSKGEQSQEERLLEPHHTSLKLKLPHPDIDFRTLATRFLAPSAYMSVSPTHERYDSPSLSESAERHGSGSSSSSLSRSEKGKSVERVDYVVEEEEGESEVEVDGAPLCREAEIEKWKAKCEGVGVRCENVLRRLT